MNSTARKTKLAAATLAALFSIAAATPATAADRFGSCKLHDSSSKAKKSAKKDKGKHRGGKHR